MKPVIFGLSGQVLADDERAFFREANPAGFILFGHNVSDRDQLRRLTDDLRALSGRGDLPILIDQEGGRVVRMPPPHWPAFPAVGRSFGPLYMRAPMTAIEAARINAEAIALIVREAGITVNCFPVLDVQHDWTDPSIGDRSFGSNPMMVAALGRAVLDGLAAGGCVGVIKHMPGQGRARCDSHEAVTFVDASAKELEIDIAPFAALNAAPMGMTAHVTYTAWDADNCATMSSKVIGDVIRTRIGFDGLLLSDDLHMKALPGTLEQRSVAALAAGCDVVLACWADAQERVAIANAIPDMTDAAHARLARAMQHMGDKDFYRAGELIAKRDALLAMAA